MGGLGDTDTCGTVGRGSGAARAAHRPAAPSLLCPQILLAGHTGPGGVVGLDDLILSEGCTPAPGELLSP